MPVASHIAVLPAHASPKLDNLKAGGGRDNKSAGPEFGQVLREQAGQAQPAIQAAKSATTGTVASGSPGLYPRQDAGQVQGQIPGQDSETIQKKLLALPAGQAQGTDAATLPDTSVPSQGKGQTANIELHPEVVALDAGVAVQHVAGDQVKIQVGGPRDLTPDAGVKAKTAKDGLEGKEDKKGKLDVARPGAAKLLVPPAAPLSTQAAVPVAVPLVAFMPAGSKMPGTNVAGLAKRVLSGGAKAQSNTTNATEAKPVAGEGLPLPDVQTKASASAVQPGADSGVQPAGAGLTASQEAKGSAGPPNSENRGKQVVAAVVRAMPAPPQRPDNPASVAAHQAAPGVGDATAHASMPLAFAAGPSGLAAPAASSNASPYDRIDQGSAPVVLHSGAQQVSVGMHDPSLGWVEIQTHSAAGHVDATLVAASGQTHDSLASQLPAISQFLEQRDVRIGTLTVHHQSAGSNAGSGFSSGSGYGSGGGSGFGSGTGNEHGNGGMGARHSRYTGVSPGRYRSAPVAGLGAVDDAPLLRPLSYISVRA